MKVINVLIDDYGLPLVARLVCEDDKVEETEKELNRQIELAGLSETLIVDIEDVDDLDSAFAAIYEMGKDQKEN